MIPFFFAQVPPTTTIVQPQALTCRRVPSRNAGFIQVGPKVEAVTTSTRKQCDWVDKPGRTIIRSF